jgi:hypothetical protein
MAKVVFESDDVLIVHEPELAAVILSWKRFAKGEGFRQGLEQGLSAARRLMVKAWIGDVQALGVVDTDDSYWVNNDWFPRLLRETSISRMAVIIGSRAITKLSVGAIMSKVSDRLTNRYVASIDEARTWVGEEARLAKTA